MYTSSAKRPRMESSLKKDFELRVTELNEWFDKTEVNLELLTTEPADPQDKLTLEEQLVLVQVRQLLWVVHINERGFYGIFSVILVIYKKCCYW